MKIRLVMFLLMLGVPLNAQQSASGSITTGGADCTTATNCVFMLIPINAGSSTISITGTWTGTVQFEATADRSVSSSSTWVALSVYPLNSTTGATSATANGVWTVNAANLTGIRVRSSTFSSGPILVLIRASPAASARLGSTPTGCPEHTNSICSSSLDANQNPNYLSTSSTSITILGATTPLVYYVAGVQQTVSTTVTIPNCGSQPCWTTPGAEQEIFIFALRDTSNAASVSLSDIAVTSCPPLISYVHPSDCGSESATNLQFYFNLGTDTMMSCSATCGTYSNFSAKPAILLGVAMVSTTPTVDGILGMPYAMNPVYIYENFGDGSGGSSVLNSGTTTADGEYLLTNFGMSNATLQHTAAASNVNTPGLLIKSQTPIILASAQGNSALNVNGLGLAGASGTAGTCSNANGALPFGIGGGGGGSGGANTTNAGCKGTPRYTWGFNSNSGAGSAGTAGTPGTAGGTGGTVNNGWAGSGVDPQMAQLEYWGNGFGGAGAAGAGVVGGGTGGNGGSGGGVAVVKAPSLNIVSGSTISANGTVGTIGTTSTSSGGCGGGGGGGTAGYIAGFSVNGTSGITANGATAVTTCAAGLTPHSSNGGAGGNGHVVAIRIH